MSQSKDIKRVNLFLQKESKVMSQHKSNYYTIG